MTSFVFDGGRTAAGGDGARHETKSRACQSCGAMLVGLRGDARYCGDACSRRRRRQIARTTRSHGPRVGPASFNGCATIVSGLSAHFTHTSNGQKPGGSARIVGPAHVVALEFGSGWRTVVSVDGVVCQARRLRVRALVDGGAR